MVVVKIELWPNGDESRATTIGLAHISNDDTGTDECGNYDVELKHSGHYFGRPGNWKTGRVTDHPRSLSPYHLVLNAFRNALFGFR